MTSFTTAGNKGTIPIPSSSGAAAALQMHQQRQIATIETPPNNSALPMQIPTVTCDLASDISTSEAGEMEPPPPHPLVYSNGNSVVATVAGTLSPPDDVSCKETLKVSTIATTHNALNAAAASLPPMLNINNNNNNMGNATADGSATTTLATLAPTTTTTTGIGAPNELRVSPIAGRCRALSVGIDTDMVSEFDPSSSDSGVVSRCAVVKPLKFRLCQPIFGKKSSSSSSSSNNKRRNETKAAAAVKVAVKPSEVQAQNATELEPAIPKVQKPRDPDKEKRRIARKKEKRATLILGLIMGSFIASWLPFFFLYILNPVCNTHCNIPESAFAIAFWLGYMNSALNPAIYTIFNKDFRRAFRRILFK